MAPLIQKLKIENNKLEEENKDFSERIEDLMLDVDALRNVIRDDKNLIDQAAQARSRMTRLGLKENQRQPSMFIVRRST